ncbi:NAD(P)H-binding protein [Amycolatopsis suaedae]|uniref:Epimerase n=1 Tax=Amycolatopsis suaedae TaxID=2510978 RepID=A0A4Q7IZF2_9PSEU|nr:NAD(P)H-binding protein [Amycolatopsis suaedae]RZQ60430.1 epimerase [Amycolatopsis suaedae]
MTVLVTGATGKVGSRVLAALAERGVAARPASRRSAVPLDWFEPAGWTAALSDVDSVFLVLPGGDDGHRSVAGLGERVVEFLGTAERAGVRRVVLMTALGMQYAPPETDQRAVELHLAASGLRWTILRPNWFHQNVTEGPLAVLAAASGGTLSLPAGQAAVSFIDARDIAAAAAVTLRGGHDGREYTLTGPESLTFADLAATGAAHGLPVRAYRAVGEEEFRAGAAALGWAADYVDTLCGLFAFIREGAAEAVAADLPALLGRRPGTFAEFAAHDW